MIWKNGRCTVQMIQNKIKRDNQERNEKETAESECEKFYLEFNKTIQEEQIEYDSVRGSIPGPKLISDLNCTLRFMTSFGRTGGQ